jgi:hypothetical protein
MSDTFDDQDDDEGNWSERIGSSVKDSEYWWSRSKKIKELYKDKRDGVIPANDTKRFNILWSNTQTIGPVLYSRLPIPVVLAKDNMGKDPNVAPVATAMKKTIINDIQNYDFDGAIKETVLDYCLTARGTAWVAYEPVFQEIAPATINPETGQEVPAQEIKVSENTYCIFVNYKDFITNKARVWEEVTWVGRRLNLSKSECKKYFPEEYQKLSYGEKNQGKACVWEIWDKDTKEQLFIAPDQVKKVLRRGPVPIKFDGFFPCPKPLYSNLDNETLIPTPDYCLYQDQADDLSKYTDRLSRIGDALKVRGVYQAVDTNVQRMFDDNQQNVLVPTSTPMEKYEPFKFVPLDVFANCAATVAELKNAAKQDIYELTGLSDIIRGASDPNETATAQNIKNQWGSLRVKEKQKDVQRFVRDVIRLKAEIIAEHYSKETIEASSGQKLTPEMEAILRNGVLRNFRIDIETDSTIEPDAQQDKQDRTEFLGALAGYLETALKIGSQAPEMTPMLSDLVMFGMKAFPIGTDMEQSIKQSLDALQQSAQHKAQQPPSPPPELQKAEMDNKTKVQVQQMQGQTDITLQQMEDQNDQKLRLIDTLRPRENVQ